MWSRIDSQEVGSEAATLERVRNSSLVSVSYTHLDVYKRQISAGAEMLDGSNLGARGKDLRLEELDPRTHRRSNAERRAQYHEMMDARAAVRDAMMAERKAGHWADPTVDDDRHDETSLFGHGESSEDGETEE